MTFRVVVACTLLGLAACAPAEPVASVPTVLETPPIGQEGDAADDPAIWVGPTPAQSRVIGTQKKGGYFLYDLAGAVTQAIPLGLPNNVDLVANFAWSDGPAPLVVASDRADNTVPLFRFNALSSQLETTPRARIATGFAEVYGVCIGQRGADTLVVATSKIGEVGVWRVTAQPDGVASDRIASFALGAIAEGCVVDGEANAMYVSEELRGLWRVALDDATGAKRALVDRVGSGGKLKADVEGVSIWEGQSDAGYLVVSVQGASRFNVYDRVAPNAYRGVFAIADGPGGDGVSGTDGIAVSSAPLGPDFPRGLLVAQDDENTDPTATQDFKYVSWADVSAALKLPD